MFIFSRRWLQGCINDLCEILEEEAVQKLVARLNRPGKGRLAAMWELVFLKGLSYGGRLRHEVPLTNGRQPDFEWTLVEDGQDICVVGDITTVSDAGLDAKNPVDHLSSEITRLARKYGLDPNHFRYEVRGGRVGEYRKSVMKLQLPEHPKLQHLIKVRVEPFFRDLSSASQPNAHFSHTDDCTDFSITYDQSQMFAGGGYTAYEVAASLTNNPIFNALKGKTAQLAGAPDDALRLIILCDADCSAMSREHISCEEFSARSIAEDFLRKSTSIDMVLLATVQNDGYGWLVPRRLVLKFDLITARPGALSARMTSSRFAAVRAALERAVSVFPIPKLEPINAVRRCAERGYGVGKRGAYMSNRTIKISSRALLQLLAGDISQDEFLEAHGWKSDEAKPTFPSLFKQALEGGRMIKKVTVESASDDDDDWIEFDFAEPDPAISPFRMGT